MALALLDRRSQRPDSYTSSDVSAVSEGHVSERCAIGQRGRHRDAMTWLRKPWVGPLAFVVVAFVAFSLPPYLTGDRLQSRVQSDWGPHYPLLVCTSSARRSPFSRAWCRSGRGSATRFPAWHRRIGRVVRVRRRAAGRTVRTGHRLHDAVRAGGDGQPGRAGGAVADVHVAGVARGPAASVPRPPQVDDPQLRADRLDHHEPDLGRGRVRRGWPIGCRRRSCRS